MNVIWKLLLVLFFLICIGLGFAGNYFYHYAVVPAKKDFLAEDTPGTSSNDEKNEAKIWFDDENNRVFWHQTSFDGLELSAIYLPLEGADKTVIIAHGYMGSAETMGNYAKMYHDLGYNVLVPDARGHGASQGDYIGFGWHERKDYLGWINKVLEKTGNNQSITLYGISMGAATVMMTSGEKLPKNVHSIVADCGYSSVNEELSYQLKEMFGLPSFPLIPITSMITKIRGNYFFGEANTVKQLEKNTIPIFFIHGDEDSFVPFSMLDEVYEATTAPKEKWVVQGAEHAKSYSKNPKLYQEKIADFLAKY